MPSRSSRQWYVAPILAADAMFSRVRIELISQRSCVIVPQSPGVAVAMWTVHPASARRIIVPAQRNSASSGWARKLRATRRLLVMCSTLTPSTGTPGEGWGEGRRRSRARKRRAMSEANQSSKQALTLTLSLGTGRGTRRLSTQPLVPAFGDEVVVVQVRIRGIDPVDLFLLTRTEPLVRIQPPVAIQQSLPSQNFVQSRDAAGELVGGVEERGVAVGDLDAAHEHVARDLALIAVMLTLDEQPRRLLRPNRPVAQQPANDPAFDRLVAGRDAVRREQVHHDVVVVARVQRDVIAPRLGDGADDVERLIAVERRHL